jgi:hypothetical protein
MATPLTIEEGALPDRGVDPERDGDDEGEGEGEDRQQQRVRDHRPDTVGDRQSVVERDAEISVRQIPQPRDVTFGPGLVETELLL